jgi:GDP-L-fucose synthase
MVGQALVRRLAAEECEILTVEHATLDLRRQRETEEWMAAHKPEVVFLAAATVGGILANDTYPADFLYDNLAIETHVVHAAQQIGVTKLLLLGSSCIYPRLAVQPIPEDELLAGPLEPTNQWYAIAKIAGIMLCRAYRRQYGSDFISAMPTNLYGPGDNFHERDSHVVPALMRKIHEAREGHADVVEIWGTGRPRREFLHVDDCAEALVHLMRHYSGDEHVNVGTGEDVTIRELAELMASIIGYEGTFAYDASKPDGTPQKLLDVSRLKALGWQPRIGLEEGLRRTYDWYCDQRAVLP